jgi:hypothetical protein
MRDWISLLGQSQEDWESFASSRHGDGMTVQRIRNNRMMIKATGGPVFIQKPPDLCRYFIRKDDLIGLRMSMQVADLAQFDLVFSSQVKLDLEETRYITQGLTTYTAKRYRGEFQGQALDTMIVKGLVVGVPRVQVTLGLPKAG